MKGLFLNQVTEKNSKMPRIAAFLTAFSVLTSPLTAIGEEGKISVTYARQPPAALVEAVGRSQRFLVAQYRRLLGPLRTGISPAVHADFEAAFHAALSRAKISYADIRKPAVYVVGKGIIKIDVDAEPSDIGGIKLHEILHMLVDLKTNPEFKGKLHVFKYEDGNSRINNMLEEGIVEYINRILIGAGMQLGEDLGNCPCAYKSAVILYVAVRLGALTNEDIIKTMLYRDVGVVREKFDRFFGVGAFDTVLPSYNYGSERPSVEAQDLMTHENFSRAAVSSKKKENIIAAIEAGVAEGMVNEWEAESLKQTLQMLK